jgi:hypothetical protein
MEDILDESFSSVSDFNNGLSSEQISIISHAKGLLDTIRCDSGTNRSRAIQSLIDLSENEDNVEILCLNEDLSLLSCLKHLLRMNEGDNYCIFQILICIDNLSCCKSAKSGITSKDLALLPVLMRILEDSLDSNVKIMIGNTISNCSISVDCHEYLLSFDVEWLNYLERRLKENPRDSRALQWLANFVSNMREANVHCIISREIPGIVLRIIISDGGHDIPWTYETLELIQFALVFIMNLSQFTCGSFHLKEYFERYPEFSSFFFDLLNISSSSIIGIYCTIILANVYGREEGEEGRTTALLSAHPSIVSFLVSILDAVMNWDVSRKEIKRLIKLGYLYGLVNFRDVSVALRNLSISDENKRIMIKDQKLIRLIYQGIYLFINNEPECRGMNVGENWCNEGGGGREDFITIENLLELLLQLTFIINDSETFQSTFVIPPYNLKAMMEEFLLLPDERNVPCLARQFTQQLLMYVNFYESCC